jgi:hypothetical protein
VVAAPEPVEPIEGADHEPLMAGNVLGLELNDFTVEYVMF